jgi:hypothetical protein
MLSVQKHKQFTQQRERGLRPDEWQAYVVSEGTGFYSFVLMSLRNMSRSADSQYLYRNVALQASGLSRQGRGFLSELNVVLPETSFTRKKEAYLKDRQAMLR